LFEGVREMGGEFVASFCASTDAVDPSAVSCLTLARGWALLGFVASTAAAEVDPLDRVPVLTLPVAKAPFVRFPIPVEDGLRLEELDPDASDASSIIFLQSASLKESAGGVEGRCLKRVVNWSWDAVLGLMLGEGVVSWARTVDPNEGRFKCGVWVRFMSYLEGI